MCLNLRGNEFDHPLTATEDIVVYKHLLDNRKGRYDSLNDSLLTTYRKASIEIGSTYVSEIRIYHYKEEYDEIEEALHSFGSIDECIADAESENYFPHIMPIVIVKCLIPKGSEYYQGRFCGYHNSYASHKLVYVEELQTIN